MQWIETCTISASVGSIWQQTLPFRAPCLYFFCKCHPLCEACFDAWTEETYSRIAALICPCVFKTCASAIKKVIIWACILNWKVLLQPVLAFCLIAHAMHAERTCLWYYWNDTLLFLNLDITVVKIRTFSLIAIVLWEIESAVELLCFSIEYS